MYRMRVSIRTVSKVLVNAIHFLYISVAAQKHIWICLVLHKEFVQLLNRVTCLGLSELSKFYLNVFWNDAEQFFHSHSGNAVSKAAREMSKGKVIVSWNWCGLFTCYRGYCSVLYFVSLCRTALTFWRSLSAHASCYTGTINHKIDRQWGECSCRSVVLLSPYFRLSICFP